MLERWCWRWCLRVCLCWWTRPRQSLQWRVVVIVLAHSRTCVSTGAHRVHRGVAAPHSCSDVRGLWACTLGHVETTPRAGLSMTFTVTSHQRQTQSACSTLWQPEWDSKIATCRCHVNPQPAQPHAHALAHAHLLSHPSTNPPSHSPIHPLTRSLT